MKHKVFAQLTGPNIEKLSGSIIIIKTSPEILDISSPLTKSAVFHIPKKIKHGGREDSNGKEADFVRNFTHFKLC